MSNNEKKKPTRNYTRKIQFVEKGLQWKIFGGIAGGMLVTLIVCASLCFRLFRTLQLSLYFVPENNLPFILDEAVEVIAFTVTLLVMMISVTGYYALIAAHRIAGPVYRIKEDLKKMVAEDRVFTIKTRSGDSLDTLVATLNDALSKLVKNKPNQDEE